MQEEGGGGGGGGNLAYVCEYTHLDELYGEGGLPHSTTPHDHQLVLRWCGSHCPVMCVQSTDELITLVLELQPTIQ